MNRIHQLICSSKLWARSVESDLLPWVLEGVPFGDSLLEVGPGYGATTRVLAGRAKSFTALEIDGALASRLEQKLGGRVRVVRGDGAAMPFESDKFASVVCFTMLHHVPSPSLQDRLFAEARRVLSPGGVFAGSDGLTSPGFRLLHLFDTLVPVDPGGLPKRLEAAGFVDVKVEAVKGRGVFKFRAKKPE